VTHLRTTESSLGLKTADGRESLRVAAAGQSGEHLCVWCWTKEAEERWERRQAEELGAVLNALFNKERIWDLEGGVSETAIAIIERVTTEMINDRATVAKTFLRQSKLAKAGQQVGQRTTIEADEI
jgi:hypothetical protein